MGFEFRKKSEKTSKNFFFFVFFLYKLVNVKYALIVLIDPVGNVEEMVIYLYNFLTRSKEKMKSVNKHEKTDTF